MKRSSEKKSSPGKSQTQHRPGHTSASNYQNERGNSAREAGRLKHEADMRHAMRAEAQES